MALVIFRERRAPLAVRPAATRYLEHFQMTQLNMAAETPKPDVKPAVTGTPDAKPTVADPKTMPAEKPAT
jgi:hypothetical protein